MKTSRGMRAVVAAVARRPRLWPVALLVALRLASPGWWRRWPPLPIPDPAYWQMRMTVAYGDHGDTAPDPDDAVAYLEWCRNNWRGSRRSLR